MRGDFQSRVLQLLPITFRKYSKVHSICGEGVTFSSFNREQLASYYFRLMRIQTKVRPAFPLNIHEWTVKWRLSRGKEIRVPCRASTTRFTKAFNSNIRDATSDSFLRKGLEKGKTNGRQISWDDEEKGK